MISIPPEKTAAECPGNEPEAFMQNRFEIFSEDDLKYMDELMSGGKEGSACALFSTFRVLISIACALFSTFRVLISIAATGTAVAAPDDLLAPIREDIKIEDVDNALGELKVIVICFMLDLSDTMKQIDVI